MDDYKFRCRKIRHPEFLKCLNPKCTYKKLTGYDCVCPKCGMDLYYKYHYNVDAFSSAVSSLDDET